MEEMAWISQAFAPDHHEALTRTLQINFPAVDVDEYSSSFVDALRRRNPLAPAASERISKKSKRKPRGGAGTRSPITYISADPANFREMVQRLTGLMDLEPPSGSRSPAPTSWPEPAQPVLPQILLPTLDTSALFLNQFAGGALGPAQASSHLDEFGSSVPVNRLCHCAIHKRQNFSRESHVRQSNPKSPPPSTPPRTPARPPPSTPRDPLLARSKRSLSSLARIFLLHCSRSPDDSREPLESSSSTARDPSPSPKSPAARRPSRSLSSLESSSSTTSSSKP